MTVESASSPKTGEKNIVLNNTVSNILSDIGLKI